MSQNKAAGYDVTNKMYGKSIERDAAWRLAPSIEKAVGMMLQRDMK